jgi:t-SNARE complex subunit (syntaxin)
MSKQMNELLTEQGQKLDTVERNITHAGMSVKEGVGNIKKVCNYLIAVIIELKI